MTGRYFEDFSVGELHRHALGRTITQTDNIWFTLLTLNTNPVHFDAEYAARTSDEVDPPVERLVDDPGALRGLRDPPRVPERDGSEPDHGDLEVRRPKRSVPHQALTSRSRVSGRSRSRTPVARWIAFPIAADTGPANASPAPRGGWSGRSMSATSTSGTWLKRSDG